MTLRRVVLMTTGQMEFQALKLNLQTLFPKVFFEALHYKPPQGSKPAEPFPGFTSVRANLRITGRKDLRNLVETMAATVEQKPDALVVLLDDLELVNLDQPQEVIGVFRNAVEDHLQRLPGPKAAHVRQQLQRRASFHLAVPMTEAWFFADLAGLEPGLNAQIEGDPEDFTAADGPYLADDGCTCAAWNGLPPEKQREQRPPWLLPLPSRKKHPKAYLSWLLRDPEDKKCTRYRETEQGRVWLEKLSWRPVLQTDDYFGYARAFIHDLATGLGSFPEDLNLAPTHCTPLVALKPGGILRNI